MQIYGFCGFKVFLLFIFLFIVFKFNRSIFLLLSLELFFVFVYFLFLGEMTFLVFYLVVCVVSSSLGLLCFIMFIGGIGGDKVMY